MTRAAPRAPSPDRTAAGTAQSVVSISSRPGGRPRRDVSLTNADLASIFINVAGFHYLAGVRTGFVASPLILEVLVITCRAHLAVGILLRHGYPSWRCAVTKGAMTIGARRDSLLTGGSNNSESMTSVDHDADGNAADWMYRRIAGLLPAEPVNCRAEIRTLLVAEPFASSFAHSSLGHGSARVASSCAEISVG